jgi:hypothetical protein
MELEPAAEVLAHLLEVLAKNNKTDEAQSLAQQFWSQYQNNQRFKRVVDTYQLLKP